MSNKKILHQIYHKIIQITNNNMYNLLKKNNKSYHKIVKMIKLIIIQKKEKKMTFLKINLLNYYLVN